MKVECNECGKLFTIVNEKRKHPNDIEETFFSCSYCQKEYIVLVTDPELRKEQMAIKELHQEYLKRKNDAITRAEMLKAELETDKFVDDTIKMLDELE